MDEKIMTLEEFYKKKGWNWPPEGISQEYINKLRKEYKEDYDDVEYWDNESKE